MTREKAIDTLKSIKAGFETDEWLQEDIKALDLAIEALENQKTGHWIRWREEIHRGTHYTENIPHCKCSECNKEYDPYTSKFIKYCPNCGAKIEGE